MRRIVLVLVIVAVLGLIAACGWLYIHRNSGVKLLGRSQLALRAQKYDRAVELAQRYAAEIPDDWRGYYYQARGQAALGRYKEARRLLDDAAELAPEETDILLLRADTFARPARDTLTSADPDLPTDSIRTAIGQLGKARDVLQQASLPGEEAKAEVAQALGLVLADLGTAGQRLSRHLNEDADIAAEAGAKDQAKAKRSEAEQARAQAEADRKQAADLLLAVLRDAARTKGDEANIPTRAANALVRIALEREDDLERKGEKVSESERQQVLENIEALRKLILVDMNENPPPLATTLIIRRDVRNISAETISADQQKLVREHRKRLDAIIEAYPDHPETLEARLEGAHLAYLLGNYDKTQEICDQVLADLPRQRRARLYRALVKMQQGKLQEAEQDLFALKTDSPHWPRAHFAYAQAALRTGKTERAREALRYVTQRAPAFPGAHLMLGENLLEDGFADEALSEAQTVLRDHPDNPPALRLLVDSAVAAEEPGLALEALNAAERKYAEEPAVQAAVAYGYERLGETDKARDASKKVAAAQPRTLREQLMVARGLMRLGKAAKAEALLAEAVEANPRSPAARAMLGGVYYQTGRNLQAVEQFQAAVRHAPQSTPHHLALARALLRAGMMDEAREEVRAVLARDPSHEAAALLARQIQMALGESPELEGLLETGLTGRTGLPLAMAYLTRGEAQKCIDICRRLLDKDPDNTGTRWLLGRARLAMGDRDACIEQWTEAMKAQPDELRFYQQLAIVLAADKELADVETTLAAIPGARRDLIHIASAWVLQRQGQHEAAAESYARVADRADAEKGIRTMARIAKGRCLALAGHHDLAILEFNRVPKDSPLRAQAMLAKAGLLAATDRADESEAVLRNLRKNAVDENDWRMLERIGTVYLRTDQPKKALALADDAAEAALANPRPVLLRAAALTRLGRLDDAIKCYREAVALQPGNLAIHIRLIEALDDAARRRDALQAVDDLLKRGRTGRTLALLQRGALFSRWGLQKQAVQALRQLADSDVIDTPRVRLTLGRALAALGQKEAASAHLAAVPPYAPQYLEAQQRLADLADTDEEKLAILRRAEKEHPAPTLAAQRIRILLHADRPAGAVKAFRAYLGAHAEDNLPPPALAAVGLGALLADGNEVEAANLAGRIARRTDNPQWRHTAVLLAIRTDPNASTGLLPPVDRAGPYDALLGLCRAAGTDGEVSAWADRVFTLQRGAAEADPPRPFPLRFGVLAALVAGNAAQAEKQLEGADDQGLLAPPVMRELVTAAKSEPAVQKEAADLLASSIALDLGLNETGRRWAWETLKARPASQWAATLATRGVTDLDHLHAVADLLEPKDCVAGQMMRMSILRLEGKFEEAAQMARALAKAHEHHPDLLMNQAMAVERAGRPADALPLYRRVWEKTGNPVAANNAAYLATQLHTKDAKRLAEALDWTKAAVQQAPDAGAFRDTRGWIAYLLGDYDEARRELCRAVKRIPDAPEVHYHLGMAEQKTGDTDLARRHLEAAVDLVQAAKSREEELTEPEAEAGRLAQDALAKLDGADKP